MFVYVSVSYSVLKDSLDEVSMKAVVDTFSKVTAIVCASAMPSPSPNIVNINVKIGEAY